MKAAIFLLFVACLPAVAWVAWVWLYFTSNDLTNYVNENTIVHELLGVSVGVIVSFCAFAMSTSSKNTAVKWTLLFACLSAFAPLIWVWSRYVRRESAPDGINGE